MSEILADRIELDSLVGVANQKSILDQTQANWRAGVAGIQSDISNMNGTTTFTSASPPSTASPSSAGEMLEEDAAGGAIINRSPTTNYHYYQTPQPTPGAPVPIPAIPGKTGLSPWWLAIPLALMLGGLAWYFWPKATPVTPQQPGSDYRIIPGTW